MEILSLERTAHIVVLKMHVFCMVALQKVRRGVGVVQDPAYQGGNTYNRCMLC